jgi:hypothetical protein
MKIKFIIFSTLLILLIFSGVNSQPLDYSKLQVGLTGGIFRISIDKYNSFYGSRVAYPIGGSIGYAISPSFHIFLRGKYFEKSNSEFDQTAGRDLNRVWQESWIELGIQQYTISFAGNMRSYLGFGLAMFFIDEQKDGDFLQNYGYKDSSIDPRGFYLCVGFDRFITRKLTFNFELEMSSAGAGNGTNLESQSIGGIFAGVGLNLLLF